MAVLIHATRTAVTDDEVTYEFVLPPSDDAEVVVVPVADPNAFQVTRGTHHSAAARVVARAVRVRANDGQWPPGFTLAS